MKTQPGQGIKKWIQALILSGLASANLAFITPPPVPQYGNDANQGGQNLEEQGLLHQVYSYQEQEMDVVNWLYIGYAPRVNDPSRVKVYISKQGFTIRVNILMSPEELADYPAYLVRRARAIHDKWSDANFRLGHQLNFTQDNRVWPYISGLLAMENEVNQGSMNDKIQRGYRLLTQHFPYNIQIVPGPDGRNWIEGNFVYPVTINRHGLSRPLSQVEPEAKSYTSFGFQERRSQHNAYGIREDGTYGVIGVQDHLFDGFPAFWLDPGGKSIGLHGPIRYSTSRPTGNQADGPHIIERWRNNDYLNDPSLLEGIDPLYRFEVIRTANSEGCFRGETMEIRQLLPANPDAVRRVEWIVLDHFDQLRDGSIVDLNYYVENHYRGQSNPREWHLRHFLTYQERTELSHQEQEELLDWRLQHTVRFPYLHPRVAEFEYLQQNEWGQWVREAAPATMQYFNRAGF